MQVPRRKAEERRARVEEDYAVTQAALDRMVAEREHLERVERPRWADEVARTGAMGDLSENAGYQVAKGKLRGVNSRVLTLTERIRRAVVIPQGAADGTVRVGSAVNVLMRGAERRFTILGSQETDPAAGAISRTSPIGRALLGHAVGDTVTAATPTGETALLILAIG